MKQETTIFPNIVYIKGKQYDATENSVCYRLMWRQIHEDFKGDKYISIDGLSGKSETIYIDKPEPKDNTHVEGFTGGEWIVDERNGKLFIEAIGNDGEETFAVEICQLHGNEAIDRADAALIAQAKNMYKALQEIIDYEDRGRAKGEPRIAEKFYNLAKTALLKANPKL